MNQIEGMSRTIKNKKTSFEVNPLDINLAKIQMKFQKEFERIIPEHGDFTPIIERYISKDPTLNISEIELLCKKSNQESPKQKLRTLEINVSDRAGLNKYNYVIVQGEKKDIIEAVLNNKFLETCKSVVLSVNEVLK